MNSVEKNYIHLTPSLFQRLIGNDEMFVIDMKIDDEYILDRFFIAEKVTVTYPDGNGEYLRDDIPDCSLYRIRYRRKDRDKVITALNKMQKNMSLLADGEEYHKAMEIFTWMEEIKKDHDKLEEVV